MIFKHLKNKYQTLNTVRIFEDAFRNNIAEFRKLNQEISVCPVLKSNAYGHGLVQVAKIMEKEKPDFLIVDSLYEAYKIHKNGIKTPILILGYTSPENLQRKKTPFHLSLSDFESIKTFAKLKNPVHLEIDTGMSRMGFTMDELDNALDEIIKEKLEITGLFTHLADADNPNDTFTNTQIKNFEVALWKIRARGIDPKWIHVSNTAGSLHDVEDVNMTRLGIGLYGISPFEQTNQNHAKLKNLKPCMEVISTLILVKKIQKDQMVSYGCTFKASKDMKIGVIPFGYYEGIPRSLSNNGCVEVNGKICRIIGRVCMNHTIIDLSDVNAKIGDEVTVYSKKPGDENFFSAQAKKAGTIPYELVVGIAESVRREKV